MALIHTYINTYIHCYSTHTLIRKRSYNLTQDEDLMLANELGVGRWCPAGYQAQRPQVTQKWKCWFHDRQVTNFEYYMQIVYILHATHTHTVKHALTYAKGSHTHIMNSVTHTHTHPPTNLSSVPSHACTHTDTNTYPPRRSHVHARANIQARARTHTHTHTHTLHPTPPPPPHPLSTHTHTRACARAHTHTHTHTVTHAQSRAHWIGSNLVMTATAEMYTDVGSALILSSVIQNCSQCMEQNDTVLQWKKSFRRFISPLWSSYALDDTHLPPPCMQMRARARACVCSCVREHTGRKGWGRGGGGGWREKRRNQNELLTTV